ncbi:MAG: hypothetical protein GC147_05720 [Porphyrobacter sp.]|nr:hypothetical protein [Porphyrobacter sp.]
MIEDRTTLPIILGILLAATMFLAGRFQRRRVSSAPEPDLDRGRILVTGWSAAETKSILADFARLYTLPSDIFALAAPTGEPQRITWNQPIASDIAFYLVNYLHYPMDMALAGRKPEVVAVIAVPSGIAPGKVPAGTLAKVFVPVGDTEHDLVHALSEAGRAFRISFTRLKWEPVADARAPALAGQVAFALEG